MQLPGVEIKKQVGLNRNSLGVALLVLIGLAGLVWLNAALILPHTALETPDYGNDLGYFWTASRTVWQGGDPYLSAPGSVYHNVRLAAGGNPIMVDPYKSPFYLTLLFMPIATLPLPAAAVAWLVLSQVLMLLTILMILRLAEQPITPTALIVALALTLVWRYTFLTVIVGQLSLVLLFLIVASYYCSRTDRPLMAGGLAALLLIKPQIVFLVIPLLLLMPTGQLRQNYRRLLGFGATSLVLLVYSFGLAPRWLGQWLQTVFGTSDSYFDNRQVDTQLSSLRSLAALLSPQPNLVLPLLILMSLPLWAGFGWLWWRHRHDMTAFPYLLGLAIGVNLLTTPYVRDYDNYLLLFGLLFGYEVWQRREKRRPGLSWLAWLLALLPIPVHILMLNLGNAVVELVIPILVCGLLLLVWNRTLRAERRQA